MFILVRYLGRDKSPDPEAGHVVVHAKYRPVRVLSRLFSLSGGERAGCQFVYGRYGLV